MDRAKKEQMAIEMEDEVKIRLIRNREINRAKERRVFTDKITTFLNPNLIKT